MIENKNVVRYIILILIVFLWPVIAMAQVNGYWKGTLDLGSQQLEIGFDIKNDDSLTAALDVPAQGAYGIPAECIFADNELIINVKSIGATYKGSQNGEKIVGTFSQGGAEFPLELTKSDRRQARKVRPQDPKEPLGYIVEDVFFENTIDNITLAGTLTMPRGEGPFPAVVLVSGSGTQNRDEELMDHRPFRVIADHLTRHGIAVLRYDDRGFAPSQGDASTATTADLANDAHAAFNYLLDRKETDNDNIGFMGHSEGGMIDFMVAAREPRVAFIVSLAGPAVKGSVILKQQQRDILKAQGYSDEAVDFVNATNAKLIDIVVESGDIDSAVAEINQYLAQFNTPQATIDQYTGQLCSPWMYYFLRHDPLDDIVAAQCPALLLNGTKDLQVNADINLSQFKKIAKQHRKKNLVIRKMKGLNHLFQHCTTGHPDEYYEIDETIAPEVLEIMTKFIKKHK